MTSILTRWPALHAGQPLFDDKPVEFSLPGFADDPLDDLYDEMEILVIMREFRTLYTIMNIDIVAISIINEVMI